MGLEHALDSTELTSSGSLGVGEAPHSCHQEAPHHSQQGLGPPGAGAFWHEEEPHLHQGCHCWSAPCCQEHVQVSCEHSGECHHCQRCLCAAWSSSHDQGGPRLEARRFCRPQAHPCAACRSEERP